MTMLPPQPVPDLATREDVAAASAVTRSEIAAVRSELTGEISAVRSELTGEIAAVRGEIAALSGAFNDKMATQTRVLTAWIVTAMIAIVGLGLSGAFAGGGSGDITSLPAAVISTFD